MNYIHPSISSKIIDNTHTFVTAQGTTKLFAVFTSERGEDNVIKMVTSPSEFIFYYGEPDIEKYGQTGYNIMNWLKSGGGVYALRVLPEDAGYANAMINIQTKTGVKEVLDKDGEIVTVPNVTIRPSVTYTDVNNTSLKSILDEELSADPTETIDGFQNNLLMAVVPRGRGAGYNDLGFKLSLSNGYDSTYEFRVYNFEVTKIMPNGGMQTIEGPFEVSLDPDAITKSGESIFIKNVIETYSDYFDILFSEPTYDRLGEIINPHVHPQKLDFFNGHDRITGHGDTDTYYDPITKKDESVHLSLKEYTGGNPTGRMNIVTIEDMVENTISKLDNAHRDKIYKEKEKSIERLRKSLSRVKKIKDGVNPFADTVEYLLPGEKPGNKDEVNKLAKEAQETVSELLEKGEELDIDIEKESDENQQQLNEILLDAHKALFAIEKSRNKSLEALDYADVITGTSDKVRGNLTKLDTEIFTLEHYKLKISDIKEHLYEMQTKLVSIPFTEVNEEVISYCTEVLVMTNDVIRILDQLDVDDLEISDGFLEIMEEEYAELFEILKEMQDDALLKDDRDEYTTPAFKTTKKLLYTIEITLDATLVEVNLDKMTKMNVIVENLASTSIEMLKQTVELSEELDAEELSKDIQIAQRELYTFKQNTYLTLLQNYDRNVRLQFGSDGEIANEDLSRSERQQLVNKLLIRGYTGIIDNSLLDKKILPIDIVLDANYDISVKNAIIQLASMRNDFMGILDLGFAATPQQTLDFRRNRLQVSDIKIALFGQDFIVDDAEFTGRKIKVTPPYFLASKIPLNDNNHGIHWNFVGPRRGTISGFEKLNYNPNPEWKEQLYKAQVNYVEQDINRTKFGSQLTSQTIISALSNINNVRTLLRIRRDVERLMEDYQFEFHDSYTLNSAQLALNGYLEQWTANRACDSISGTVYASEYDRKQKLLRVKIELTFNSIIERISIDLIVNE